MHGVFHLVGPRCVRLKKAKRSTDAVNAAGVTDIKRERGSQRRTDDRKTLGSVCERGRL